MSDSFTPTLPISQPTIPNKSLPASTASSGKLLNTWFSSSTSSVSGTTILPYDDTTPLITEGLDVISIPVSPSSPTSKLKVTLRFWCHASGAHFAACALFVDSTCVAAMPITPAPTAFAGDYCLVFYIDSFVGQKTISFRAGADRNTITFRVQTGVGPLFGSLDPEIILVEEIMQ